MCSNMTGEKCIFYSGIVTFESCVKPTYLKRSKFNVLVLLKMLLVEYNSDNQPSVLKLKMVYFIIYGMDKITY